MSDVYIDLLNDILTRVSSIQASLTTLPAPVPAQPQETAAVGDWRGAVTAVYSGSPIWGGNPLRTLQNLYASSRTVGGGNNWPNVYRALVAYGLDEPTATYVEDAFGSGEEAEQAARALGLEAEFTAGGQAGLRP